MHPKNRVVTHTPLTELWDDASPLLAKRNRTLNRDDLRLLLQAGAVQFVVAEPGLPLHWVPEAECHIFWKADVRPHLVNEPERPFDIYQYPHGYAYIATEWRDTDPLA